MLIGDNSIEIKLNVSMPIRWLKKEARTNDRW